ncbi:4-hydroxy-tetrahydrodipicolinate synthase [Lacibacterium aquatile]|uniref:4-hydroxy-tetrahydrodipicolinate synthase n=1 Tax=Lacibacterium aquatile TaxID=1168082 RepID=A0ABW5DRA7_9PROT
MSGSTRFTGSMTALITPMKDGKLDEAAFRKLVEWQIANGTKGLIPVGTTGESPTVSYEEHKRVVELCVEVAKGRAAVIAGAGSNSTAEAIDFMLHAEKAGADAALVVTPYYNKPNQEGLYLHYKALHDCCTLPIFIYNIPGRSVIDMTAETMGRLAELPRIIGVKDATADLARPLKQTQTCGKDFIQLSGEDATALASLIQGGDGCISVTANIAPRLLADMHEAWAAGDIKTAMAINERLFPVHEAMFCETSPAPVKYAASLLGLSSPECRLPIAPLSEAGRAKVESALRQAGLMN